MSLKKNLVFTVLTFAFFCLLLEGGLRTYFWALSALTPPPLEFESRLGWAPPASTGKYGFKAFGDPNSPKKKVWVIGDSFTQAANVAPGWAYYDHFAKRADMELFAFGCGGYGTLQEYMVLEKYFDEIKPDLILWQFGGNDLVNNDHEIESRSRVNNNRNIRPYWKNGRIEWAYPREMSGVPVAFTRWSVLARLLAVNWGLAHPAQRTVEEELVPGNPLLERSESTTADILRMAKRRAGDTPIVAFLADDGWRIGDANFERICSRADVTFWPGIPDLIRKAKEQGMKVEASPRDSHWSALGHQIAGAALLKRLEAALNQSTVAS